MFELVGVIHVKVQICLTRIQALDLMFKKTGLAQMLHFPAL